ncbi:MAG: ROK family protein [Thermoleophilaceae bacterium]|nr:ROK family protein [Thermoleophilaceae bacterium]
MRARRVIGIDSGGTKFLGGVVDEELHVHHRVARMIGGLGADELLDVMAEAVLEAREVAPDADAVGFGIPSVVDQRRGSSVSSRHLPLGGVAFRELMTERIGLPVYVDNDANLAILAEHRFGAARFASHVVLLTLGTGIGSGLVLDGKVYRGAIGGAAEIGHMTVDLDGPKCPGNCPNRGCLEALVSGAAIGHAGRAAALERPRSALGRVHAQGREITGQVVTDLARDGDETAVEILDGAGRMLGVGIVNVVNIFNPEVVIVGGGAIAAGELLLQPAREVVLERALDPNREMVRIVPAHFGHEAGMLGGAVLALSGGRA